VTAASVAPPQAVTSSPAPVTEAGVPPVESVAPPGLGSTGVTSSVGLVVHVAGKVRRPGIVTLPAGSRVIDALQQAGGPRRGVDLSGLNLARPLADGEQILVGTPVPAAVPPPAPAIPGQPVPGVGAGVGAGVGPAVVNLNTATSAQLEELPGIGPVTAASILQWRAEHGRFSTVEELLEVSGIGDATLADLRELVTV
ncbi:MAG TPA: ComEA family DNA-binding protein, partial [Nocardioidaceae bacterium]|nr:ComEA family DNA-binding protein [Nocardioidaceae bacterium]